jgi:hypothetical protein
VRSWKAVPGRMVLGYMGVGEKVIKYLGYNGKEMDGIMDGIMGLAGFSR